MSDLNTIAEQLPADWDADFTSLLDELTEVQTELLAVLEQKRRLLGQMDSEGLDAIQDREGALVGRLQQCKSGGSCFLIKRRQSERLRQTCAR